jgi:hypothetical protein
MRDREQAVIVRLTFVHFDIFDPGAIQQLSQLVKSAKPFKDGWRAHFPDRRYRYIHLENPV